MKMPRPLILWALLTGLGGLAAQASATTAKSETADVVRATLDGHAYQTGGYGKEEVAAMVHSEGPYDLRLTFSEGKHDAYVAGLKLRIEDAAGRQVFAYRDAGPLTDVKLPAGHYRVVADYKGVERSAAADIKPGGHADLYLHWPKDMG